MVTLFCVAIGVAGSAFSIDIDTSNSVHHLKTVIKAKKSATITCDADRLQLFLAKTTDGAWLTENEVKNGVSDTSGLKLLDIARARLRRVGLSDEQVVEVDGDEEAAGNGPVNVLVVVPRPREKFERNKRPRLENPGVLEEVPQIGIGQGVEYVTLPAAFLEKCGLASDGDLTLYCRSQVQALWDFLRDEVVDKETNGYIVGPFGIGKSVCTLSFATSLDRQEWNVVWIQLSGLRNSFLDMGTKQYGRIFTLSTFDLPRVTGKKLFLCVDGYKETPDHSNFAVRIFTQLKDEDRVVFCSSMATLGTRNDEDDTAAKLNFVFMHSWTQGEYLSAIADEGFYNKIKATFDATSACEVNDGGDKEEELCGEDKKKYDLNLKFYYAGGSCRFMFQYPTGK